MAAHCIAYSFEHGLQFSMPYQTNDKHWNPIYLQHLVHPDFVQGVEDILVNENGFAYQQVPFEESWRGKNIILNGYFQSNLYTDKYRDVIIGLFNLPYEFKKDVCSIQARFGDYLYIPGKHILVDETYLKSAMEVVKAETGIIRFKVFSDDLKYFKENFGNLYDFEYSTNTSEMDDLAEISSCHSNINSSSTFAWWGAYLNRNPDKVIITQRDWFQPGWMNMDTSTIIPDNWIKL